MYMRFSSYIFSFWIWLSGKLHVISLDALQFKTIKTVHHAHAKIQARAHTHTENKREYLNILSTFVLNHQRLIITYYYHSHLSKFKTLASCRDRDTLTNGTPSVRRSHRLRAVSQCRSDTLWRVSVALLFGAANASPREQLWKRFVTDPVAISRYNITLASWFLDILM